MKPVWKYIAGGALICAVGLIVIRTEDQVRQSERLLQQTLMAQVQRENTLSTLYQLMGYGGVIHNFKNYVLRGELHYAETARQQAQAALLALGRIEESFRVANASFMGGRTIRVTLQAYLNNIDLAIDLKAAGLSTEEIDRQVRIDDRSAMEGLADVHSMNSQIGIVAVNRAREDLESWQMMRTLALVLAGLSFIALIVAPPLRRRLSRETHNRLAFTDELLSSMERIAGTGYFIRDEETHEVQCSPGLYNLLGLDPGDGIHPFERLTARSTPAERAAIERAVRPENLGDGILTSEVIFRPRDLDERTHVVRVRRRSIGGRELTVGLVTDITDERRFARDLMSIQQRFDMARESVKMGVWDLNVALDTLEWDSEQFAIYGIGHKDFSGRRGAILQLIHEDDREAASEAFTRFLRDGSNSLNVRYRVRRPDDTVVWINRRAVARRDGEGRALRVAGIDMDISREVEVENELRKALEVASAASRAKSDFLAMVSHEVRTPLTAMLGMLHLMELEHREPGLDEYLQTAQENGEHLMRMLSDLLDMSKVEAGKLDLVEAPFSPHHVLMLVTDIFRSTADDKGLTLEIQTEGDMNLQLVGDEARVRQIASNLIGNAVKYTARGRVAATLSLIRSRNSINRVGLRLMVEDSGAPILDDLVDRLFTPFERGSGDARREAGAGLGLSICRRLARMMDGDVVYEKGGTAEKGRGNRFVFTASLPLASAESRPLPLPENGEGDSLPPLRILVAEDVAVNRRILEKILVGRWGLQVVMAVNGLEAVAALKSQAFDLVLMDIQMPEMTGPDAVSLIRATMPDLSDMPIVALTANAFEDQRREYLRLGFNACLTKPINWEEMHRLLASTRQRQQPQSETVSGPAAG